MKNCGFLLCIFVSAANGAQNVKFFVVSLIVLGLEAYRISNTISLAIDVSSERKS